MSPRSPRQRLGRRGEARAARYLRGQGLRLVQRNWRDRSGDEIDLVMREPRDDLAVLVEVRTHDGRGRGFAGGPALTIGPEKRRRMRRAAERWLSAAVSSPAAWRPRAVRIDVVALVYRGWFRWQIRWFQRALEVGGEA